MVFVDVPGDASLTPTAFTHAPWDGLHLADFVFPGFLVAAGAALGLGSRPAPVGRVLWRGARLFAIGLVLVWIKQRSISFESGTLQLIAVAWMLGALAMRLRPVPRLGLAAGILLASILIHLLVQGWGDWSVGGIESTIDTPIFGEQSELGVLCMVNASVAVMIASVVTQLTRGRDREARVRTLVAGALGCGALGALMWWGGVDVVKRAWSPSYVLVTVAGCLVVWAVLEVLLPAPRWWASPLVALGRNALAVYVAMSLIGSLVPDSVTDAFVDALGGGSLSSVLWSALVAIVLAAAAQALARRDVIIKI